MIVSNLKVDAELGGQYFNRAVSNPFRLLDWPRLPSLKRDLTAGASFDDRSSGPNSAAEPLDLGVYSAVNKVH